MLRGVWGGRQYLLMVGGLLLLDLLAGACVLVVVRLRRAVSLCELRAAGSDASGYRGCQGLLGC